MPNSPRILVIGSLNLDWTATVDRLPPPGATITAQSIRQAWGGKGANQAIAASRQGASVSLLGRVGTDDAGAEYLKHLSLNRIDVTAISTELTTPTGIAWIVVDPKGENTIVVIPGANAALDAPSIEKCGALFSSGSWLLIQWEIPRPAVLAALASAHVAGMPVVMNPSPYASKFPWGAHPVEVLIVNEGEATLVFGEAVNETVEWVKKARLQMSKMSIQRLVVTRGAGSTLCITADSAFSVATIPVEPLDTVGAGDAFAGVLTTRLAEGMELKKAVYFANCAGALATLKSGAQDAIPDRAATDSMSQSYAMTALDIHR